MLRFFDIVLATIGLIVTLPVMCTILVVGLCDTGSPLFHQVRVGRHLRPFTLIKFRTMRIDTQSMATHLTKPTSVTKFGVILRRTKLDELPQLWNVLVGNMSMVGPRPCLFNQRELIDERTRRGVYEAKPGVTGLAQVKGIDMSTPVLLAETDREMLASLNANSYFKYIILTIAGRGSGDRLKVNAKKRRTRLD